MAFKLRDLLLICLILGLLMAALLPFLQSIREQSRMTDCSNRLRQQVMAAQAFHDSYGRLPPGTLEFSQALRLDEQWMNTESKYCWQRAQQVSAFALSLPFQSETGLYASVGEEAKKIEKFLDDFSSDLDWFGEIPGIENWIFAQSDPNVTSCLCPSDTLMEESVSISCSTQPLMPNGRESDGLGTLFWDDSKDTRLMARTNVLANAGAYSGGVHPDPERQVYMGPMSSRGSVSLKQVADADGQAFTIMYGESIGKIREGKRLRAQSWALGGLARGRGDVPWMKDPKQGNEDTGSDHTYHIFGNHRNSSLVGFGSMHPGGVNIAKVDGSVGKLARHTDWRIVYHLCGLYDGQRELERAERAKQKSNSK